MIVPFIYNLEVVSDYDHIPVFYFYLTMAKKYKGAMISHERYFIKPEDFYLKIASKESIKASAEFLQYDMPENEDLNKIRKYAISQQFEDEMVKTFQSRMDCWTYLLSKEYIPFEEEVGKLFDSIQKDYGEKIEAVLCFYEPISLRRAAEKRGIKVIHQEGTMFRTPFYRMAGYFDFKEGYGHGELEERYYKFKKESREQAVKMFSRKEICALFMTSKSLAYLDLMDSDPSYEIGIGLVDLSLGVNLKGGLINTDEILLEARKNYPNEKIITRSRQRLTGCDDNSPSSFHFILKCKKVAALHSNLSFETMLLGRKACVYGESPYAFMGNNSIVDKREIDVPLDFINFTTFGYFVPWELLRDIDYIRWRLTNPSEIEIYKRHMKFYLNDRGVDDIVLEKKAGEALNDILSTQNVKADKENKIEPKITLLENYNILHEEHARLAFAYNQMLEQYETLNAEHKMLAESYTNLLNQYNNLSKNRIR